MGEYVVLAGPTLDHALGLVRLGRLSMAPTSIGSLKDITCLYRERDLARIATNAPAGLVPLLTPTSNAPVHILMPTSSRAHACTRVMQRVCSATLEAGSFAQLAEGVLVPSWPLYYALRCRDLKGLTARLKLGMELCGSYTHLVLGDERTPTFYREANAVGKLVSSWKNPQVKPVVTVRELATFTQEAYGLRGLVRMREAVGYLLDNSASPNESVLALMMTLPCAKGGYGFRGVSLNPEVPVKGELRHLMHFDACHPDCYLELIDTNLEYESNERHVGARAVAHDKARRNDIQAMGIEVKDVTWDILSHFDELEKLVGQVLLKERDRRVRGWERHAREVRNPDHKALRKLRLGELLPPWPYEG